jgi:hypothetical protein
MTHLRRVTVIKASATNKDLDPFGAAFLQVWFYVFSLILFGAFGGKE